MRKPTKVKFVACPVCNASVEGQELGQHILREHPGGDAWKAYAEIYLDKMWFGQDEQDKRFVKEFESTITFGMLDNLFKKYSVARTIPGDDPARYERFAEMLNRYRETEMTKENVPSIVEQEGNNLRQPFAKPRPHTRRPISAITKSLWMMKQHPIVIYDGNTWEGLQRRAERLGRRDLKPGGSYRSYYSAWFEFFVDPETKKGLDESLKWLPESPAAKQIIEKAKAVAAKQGQTVAEEKAEAVAFDIKKLAADPLMRNRVTDMRLFYEGGGFL